MNWVVAPFFLPLVTGVVALLLGTRPRVRRCVVVISALTQAVVSVTLAIRVLNHGPMILTVGGWPAPLGIALQMDALSSLLLTGSSLTMAAVIAFGLLITPADCEHPLRLTLVQFLVAGTHLGYLTADLFNLFVALEVVLVASYALMTLEIHSRPLQSALPYVTVNILGGVLLLVAVGTAYALFGSLNYADIGLRAASLSGDLRLHAWTALVLAALGLKTALVPLFFWLPRSYAALPAAIAPVFAATLTKLGAYALIRVFGFLLPRDDLFAAAILHVSGIATMLVGVAGALSTTQPRAMAAYLLVSQIGYLALALGLHTDDALAAGVFHLAQEIPVIAALFVIIALVEGRSRSSGETPQSLAHRSPWFAAASLGLLVSFAGVPPWSGFWSKLGILKSAIEQHAYPGAVAALATSALTLVACLRLWLREFWSPNDHQLLITPPAGRRRLLWLAGCLATAPLVVGAGAEGLWRAAAGSIPSATVAHEQFGTARDAEPKPEK